MANPWIDISVPLENGMAHWPGDPKLEIKRVKQIGAKSPCNVSKISMSAHAGTHMDAPYHFISTGKTLDKLPLSTTIGSARVIEIKDKISIKPEELEPHHIQKGQRILFKTQNSIRCWQQKSFVKEFVYISNEAAEYLARKKVLLVGVDYLSVGDFHSNGAEIHSTLLKAGIWIIEGLNLAKIKTGDYELICLPIKLMNTDGGPARAVIRRV